MTDKENVIRLFDKLGIEYSSDENYLLLEEGNDKIVGYPYFFCRFEFTESGEFIQVGIYE